MHLVAALVCVVLGLAISPVSARLVADPPLWEPSDDEGVRLEGRLLLVVTAALTGLLLGLAGAHFGWSWSLPPVLVLFAALVVLSLVDLRVWRLPDRIVLPTWLVGLVGIVVASVAADEIDAVWWALGCSAGCYAFLKLPRLVLGRDAMGGGDIKLAALMGLFLGWQGYRPELAIESVRLTLLGLLLGSVLGVLGGLPSALRKGWRTHFPFGPALAAATVIGVLGADRLLGR